jgi:shikimate dehydrogenase
MINGNTELIAHIGYPTHAFKAPMIYNPYFDHIGVNACVVPMGCQSADYPAFLRAVFTLTNIRGALITMPHKVTTVGLLDRVTPTVNVAGACNAVRRAADGALEGDLFDGEGFVRGVQRKGLKLAGPGAGGGGRRRGLRDCRLAGRCRRRRDRLARPAEGCRRRSGRASARALPGDRVCAPVRTTRRVSTWSSTPRRWA